MPSWMVPHRHYLADYGLGVEELMNDHTNVQVNAYRALTAVGLKNQVELLTRLHDAGLLR